MAANPTRTYLTTTGSIYAAAVTAAVTAGQYQPNPWAYAIIACSTVAILTAPFICPTTDPEDTDPTWALTDTPSRPAPPADPSGLHPPATPASSTPRNSPEP